MYTCVRCKEEFEGNAPLINGVGEFCNGCKDVIRIKSSITRKNKNPENRCIWCNKKIALDSLQWQQERGTSVCNTCEKNRQWLLECIRFSDRPAKYVARVEEKEKPGRAALLAALEKSKLEQIKAQTTTNLDNNQKPQESEECHSEAKFTIDPSLEARMSRIENLLTKLTILSDRGRN
jgi:hypothetical protein